ncbi:MAG: serine hydrolase [Candidatus Parcubacteria bacterium]|jgi:D-alanyl-D-alanine endopeptidase (penicillin-binding protein 7)|nr:MAG: D-alanyl-D-alanine endopeptidase [Candidatus Parcubacteria bacterium]
MYWPFIINCFAIFLFTDISQPQQVVAAYQDCRQVVTAENFLPTNLDKKRFTKDSEDPGPEVSAPKGAVMLSADNSFLYTKEATVAQPIASLTKLMTVLVFLENNPGFDQEYKISAGDHIAGGKIHFWSGDTVTVLDLFKSALVGSDNVATRALAKSTGLSEEDFVAAMNNQAKRLGMFSSHFVEPTGLAAGNVASAQDVARLVKATLAYPEIAATTNLNTYRFTTKEGKTRIVEATNDLVHADSVDLALEGAKTGYTEEAGYCFAAAINELETEETIITVVLGASSSAERFRDTETLADWVATYFSWR